MTEALPGAAMGRKRHGRLAGCQGSLPPSRTDSAAASNAAQAAVANAAPTPTRRTPAAARSATFIAAPRSSTFTGPGETAETIALIADNSVTPGAYRQSAP